MSELVERHRRVCDGFGAVALEVTDAQWARPTPCAEWDARALVEHVIGFHEFLLIRPLGLRVKRPKNGSALRWIATSRALFAALDIDGTLDIVTELPGGARSSPRTMLAAFTTDVLVHTWDLARAMGREPKLDAELCSQAYDAAREAGIGVATDMFDAAVEVDDDADPATKLIALYGRDPDWQPPGR